MPSLERLCADKGMRMTWQRRLIARVLSESADHPDVQDVFHRVAKRDPRISLATVYRTMRLFEEEGILVRHDFDGVRSRYEQADKKHHDHLIDLETGQVIEFENEAIEKLQEDVARRLGYRLVSHKLELYALPDKRRATRK